MLEIYVPGWIWCFALAGYPLGVFHELKAVLSVAAPVRVAALLLPGYHISALAILPITMVTGIITGSTTLI